MNYAPNATRWQPGQSVLHDADAKTARMLMVVLGYRRDGRCETRYVDPGVAGARVWDNDLRVLHDPARFGVMVEREG